MKVLVGGGTGFIGSRLVSRLRARKDSARVVTRDPVQAAFVLGQDVDAVPPDADPKTLLAGVDAVVNLAGEPIVGRRWTAAQKARLRASRIDATRKLVAAMRETAAEARPKVFLSGSAVGYYGPRGDQELREDAPPGQDFLAELCREWERAALEAEALGVRVVTLRTGIVIGPGGGALTRLIPVFKLGLGGPIGSGRQYMSWIHLEDHVGMMLHAIGAPGLGGPMNVTGPHPCTNKEFSKALGKALKRPAVIPTPRLALRALLGESADIVATGQRVLPARALESGFAFTFPDLAPALKDVVARWY